MSWRIATASRAALPRQRLLPFRERTERLDRWFKRGLVLFTALVMTVSVVATSSGRYAADWLARRGKWMAVRPIGLEPPREEIDAAWRASRTRAVALSGAAFRALFGRFEPGLQDLMKVSGMAPGDAVLRWANYDQITLLSSRVFEPDDTGRSYRLRPNTRSIWVRHVFVRPALPALCTFLVPDTPEVREAARRAGAIVVDGSEHTTNSWGCRGPEPDPTAPVRGLVLGDSYMQGFFVGDDATPPGRLQLALHAELRRRVSILNTGHLGYSPEQYYHTLREYHDRFRPHFVILSVCINDFGAGGTVPGLPVDDLEEARHWIDQIQMFCRGRGVACIVCPAPVDFQITRCRREGDYPGKLSNISSFIGLDWCNPIEAFVDEHLRLVREGEARGRRPQTSPLFNSDFADGHFSPLGSDVWGRFVARRVALRLDPPT